MNETIINILKARNNEYTERAPANEEKNLNKTLSNFGHLSEQNLLALN